MRDRPVDPGSISGDVIDWLQEASRPAVVRRAIRTAALVGSILVAINHGPAILAGQVSGGRWLQIGLTVLLPFLVSTHASVQAFREKGRTGTPDSLRGTGRGRPA